MLNKDLIFISTNKLILSTMASLLIENLKGGIMEWFSGMEIAHRKRIIIEFTRSRKYIGPKKVELALSQLAADGKLKQKKNFYYI